MCIHVDVYDIVFTSVGLTRQHLWNYVYIKLGGMRVISFICTYRGKVIDYTAIIHTRFEFCFAYVIRVTMYTIRKGVMCQCRKHILWVNRVALNPFSI